MRLMLAAALASAVPFFGALPVTAMAQQANSAMTEVLAHPRRQADRARDQHRHPAETLAFFQVKPGMVVADYMPSAGWYTRLLVPYLGKEGTYIGLNPDVTKSSPDWQKRLGDAAGTVAKLVDGWHGPGDARAIGVNVGAIPAELNGTVDRVLMFREFHNQLRFGWLDSDMAAIHALLKPDGLEIRRQDTGRTLADHMRDEGFDPDAVARGEHALGPHNVAGYLELHIEQGPVLESEEVPIAIVTGIPGSRRLRQGRVVGEYNHSGATPRKGFRPGQSGRVGSMSTRSFVRYRGTEARTRSARSPCGSMRRNPAPATRSWRSKCSKAVDLPEPVLPTRRA